jgi:hypothetical protein
MTILQGKTFIIRLAALGGILAAGCATSPQIRPPLPQEPVQLAPAAEREQVPAKEKQSEAAAPGSYPQAVEQPSQQAYVPEQPVQQAAAEPPQQAAVPEQPVQRAKMPPQPPSPSPLAADSALPTGRHETVKKPAAAEPSEKQEVITIRPGKYESLAGKNDNRLLQVYVGMSRASAVKIMGRRGSYKREFWTDMSNQNYEVLFYLTRAPKKGNAVTDRCLTPVLFKKGRVYAIGNYQLKKVRQTAKRAHAPAAASM